MYCEKLQTRSITTEINGYHVKITGSDGKILFQRKPENNNWLDVQHEILIKAIENLERCILNVRID